MTARQMNNDPTTTSMHTTPTQQAPTRTCTCNMAKHTQNTNHTITKTMLHNLSTMSSIRPHMIPLVF